MAKQLLQAAADLKQGMVQLEQTRTERDQAKANVHTMLDDNRHLVIALRDELLSREELVGDEIIDVLHEAENRQRLSTTAPS